MMIRDTEDYNNTIGDHQPIFDTEVKDIREWRENQLDRMKSYLGIDRHPITKEQLDGE